MTKADIVEALYEKVGFSKKEAADLVELVFDTIKGSLASGDKIKISGFGNFVVREKRSRIGRNPQTGQSIESSPRGLLPFRPSEAPRAEANAPLKGKPISAEALKRAHAADESDEDGDDAE